jgi:hypothetical protein
MKIKHSLALVATLGFTALAIAADVAKSVNIATLYKDKTALAGKQVQLKGKVVKVNNGIMNRNWLHVQDGSGDANSNDLTVTTAQTAKLGDQVVVKGVVVLNKDFGAGYNYALLLEDASVTPAK